VQRAALAAVVARLLAEDLGEHAAGVRAAGQQVAVVAVGGEDHVAVGEQLERDDAGDLLADRHVEVPDVGGLGQRDQRLLEAADHEHAALDLQQPALRKAWQHDGGLLV
jgi:hypothetical protein